MSEKAFYELEGIRDGEPFTAEILGEIELAEAASLARYYADLWASRVRLYRVPYLNISSTPWAADEKVLIDEFTGDLAARIEPREQWKGQNEWLRGRFSAKREDQ